MKKIVGALVLCSVLSAKAEGLNPLDVLDASREKFCREGSTYSLRVLGVNAVDNDRILKKSRTTIDVGYKTLPQKVITLEGKELFTESIYDNIYSENKNLPLSNRLIFGQELQEGEILPSVTFKFIKTLLGELFLEIETSLVMKEGKQRIDDAQGNFVDIYLEKVEGVEVCEEEYFERVDILKMKKTNSWRLKNKANSVYEFSKPILEEVYESSKSILEEVYESSKSIMKKVHQSIIFPNEDGILHRKFY